MFRFGAEYAKLQSGPRNTTLQSMNLEAQGKGYDRLYFDLNRDGDLTNDAPAMAQQHPPAAALFNYPSFEQEVCFDDLSVPWDFR